MKQYLRRAAALLVGLTLLVAARVPTLADEAEPATETEPTEKHEQTKPAKPQEDSDEMEEAAPAEQDDQEADPQEAEPTVEKTKTHKYGASWTSDAFDGQTLNYTGELIVGVGTDISIDPAQDIALTRDGQPTGAPSSGEVNLASSNEQYMSVSDSGLFAARKGSAQLHVTVDLPDGSQKQLRKSVKIVDEPTIRFAPDSVFLMDGDALDLGQFAKAPLLKASPNVNAQVRYRLEPVRVESDSRVELGERSGKLKVKYTQPGDIYRVVAETYSGSQASCMLYMGGRADRIELSSSVGALDNKGRLTVASGHSVALSAVAYCGDAPAVFQNVIWTVENGADVAAIDKAGVLSIAPGLRKTQKVTLLATSEDGATMTLNVLATAN